MGSRTLASRFLSEHRSTRLLRILDHFSIHPSKKKSCRHTFRAQRSHWLPHVTVGQLIDTIKKYSVPQLGVEPQPLDL